MSDRFDISVVIPTLGRTALLRRVLDRLDAQALSSARRFEVVVVADAAERGLDELDRAIGRRGYPVRRLRAERPGASAARNVGWRAAQAPLVLFLDDDVLPTPRLVTRHLDRHDEHRDERVGVLGRVRWARELRVTPFMRWLDEGIQFDFGGIDGTDAGWARFYTANASVKRSLVERVGGFDEERFPFGYEDLDLALRMHEHGFTLLYDRKALADHLHPMDVDLWRRRMPRIAASERQFVRVHPEFEPYFLRLFSEAAAMPRPRGRGARLAGVVPRWTPYLGRRVWDSADLVYRQALAPAFLEAWNGGQPEAR